MNRLLIFTILFLSTLVVLAACSDDDGRDTDVDASDSVELTDVTSDDDSIFMDTSCVGVNDPNGDADEDGILNGTEDRNRNCQLEDDETDPSNPDTDGDGLLDGEEDIDRNGETNNGELDPRLRDTDGDGVPDALESLAQVCRPELLASASSVPAEQASSVLALPPGFKTNPVGDAPARIFDDFERGLYGFAAEIETAEGLNSLYNSQISAIVGSGNNPVTLASREFFTWGISGELAPRAARASQLEFAYGPGSSNPTLPNISPQRLRDETLQAIAGGEFDWEQPYSSPCSTIRSNLLVESRGQGGSALVFAIFSCVETLEDSSLTANLFQDLGDGTAVGPTGYSASDFRCAELEVSGAASKVDFLWVVDNSGSMADEQALIASTAQRFVDTLNAAGVDWRLGVTTTESWLLDTDPAAVDDPLLDTCSGLRGAGFLSKGRADALELFNTYLTEDSSCDPSIAGIDAPQGANICGDGRESGLQSGLEVLDRAAPDAAESCGDGYHFRSGARQIVVWVSDEDDHAFKFDDLFEPVSPLDPRRISRTAELVDGYVSRGAIGCAIVGDGGPPQGVCEPLENSSTAVDGAQFGLGYLQVAGATGGAYGSICNDDLQPTIDACTAQALGVASDFVLQRVPVSHTLQVAVDGEILARSRNQGWDYDPDVNAIVFYDIELTDMSRVAVSFVTWESLD